jgi:hypothetical protein
MVFYIVTFTFLEIGSDDKSLDRMVAIIPRI